jgi:N-acetylglutamate synthase-like GNAT family acetyltransferase
MTTISYQFITTSDAHFEEARRLRWEILRAPQAIPFTPDWQDDVPGTHHLVAIRDGEVIGYGRVHLGADGARIRYMAVSEKARGGGVGSTIVLKLVDRARQTGARTVYLHARFNAIEFYRKLGFIEVGGFFNSEETALPHKRMEWRG